MIDMLTAAYGKKFPNPTKEVVSVWYDCLSDLDSGILMKTIKRYIQEEPFPPTVASLRTLYIAVRKREESQEPEHDDFYRFRNLQPEILNEYMLIGIITEDGCIDCDKANDEQISLLQKVGAL